MVSFALALVLALAPAPVKPDLKAHFVHVHGRRVLTVSRAQWNGIRKALFDLDRKTLAALVSAKHGLTATLRCTRDLSGGYTQRLSRARFLDIGRDDDYYRDPVTVSTADKGDTVYFKWLWIGIASVERGVKVDWGKGLAYDRRARPYVWELHGEMDTDGRHPDRIVFGAEGGRLVIRKIEANYEFD